MDLKRLICTELHNTDFEIKYPTPPHRVKKKIEKKNINPKI